MQNCKYRSAYTMDIRVVSLKLRRLRCSPAEWIKDPMHLYIGRENEYHPELGESKWHNPYSVKRWGVLECLERYRYHIIYTRDLWYSLAELDGKDLGCWCETEELCHGYVLKQLRLEQIAQEPNTMILFH